jgi:hypothetical protein
MAETDFRKLAKEATIPWVKQAYEIICRSLPAEKNYITDSKDRESKARHPVEDIDEIKKVMFNHVQAQRVKDGGSFQTIEEATDRMRMAAFSAMRSSPTFERYTKDGKRMLRMKGASYVRDGFWNPASGVGSADDPGMYNFAYTPVSMSPQQATAVYSSGGIPAVVTDKKAKGCLLNGYGFEGSGWKPDEFKTLGEYAEGILFGPSLADSLRDGLIYGGAICYPRLKQDTVESLTWTLDELLIDRRVTKDSIEHFVTTDRWNCVIVPNWNVTARDYLTPSHYYIPIGGVEVSTRRSAVVRPKLLPYWGMLPQIGWGISDFEGYITSILAYQIVIMSIPVMAQQMSILFHEIPIDAQLAMAGIDDVMELMQQNTSVMDTWSILHPATVPSVGEVKAVERHYEGFADLVSLLQVDIAARSELPQTVLFPSAPTGLADSRGEDVLLKQAESVQKISITVAPQFRQVVKMLALSCFGPEYFDTPDGMRKLNSLAITFNPPSIQTAKEKADSADKFATFVSTMTSSDLPVDAVLELSKQFFPDVEIPESIMARLRQIGETDQPPAYVDALSEGGLAEKLAGAVGPSAQIEKVLTAQLAEKLPEMIGADGGN